MTSGVVRTDNPYLAALVYQYPGHDAGNVPDAHQ